MKYLKTLIGFLLLVVLAIVIAQIAEAEGGVTFAMAIAVFTKVCAKNTGGNTRVFLTEAANISSVTVTSNEISAALTMVTGKTFHESQADIDTVIRTEVAEGRRNNISYTHRVEMKFAAPSALLNVFRESLTAGSPCGLAAIVQDANGDSWLVGWNETDEDNRGLFVASDDANSGALPDDEDGNVVTIALETKSGYLDLPFDSTIGATITGDTAAFITYV